MNCELARTLVFDHLDDLLEPADAHAFHAHVAACAACRALRDAGARQHARVLTPYPVAAPSQDLPARVRQRHRESVRRVPTWTGYAASFAAGVLATILLHAPLKAAPPAPATPPVAVQPSPEQSLESPASHLRRIR